MQGFRSVKAIKLYVGDQDSRYSSVWRFWEKKRSVYALSEMFGGAIKASFHPNKGICQFGYDGDYWRKVQDALPTARETFRPSHRWYREISRDSRSTTSLKIEFPTEHQRSPHKVGSDQSGTKPAIALPQAKLGDCTSLSLTFARAFPDDEHLNLIIRGRIIAGFELKDGEFALLTCETHKFDSSFLPESVRERDLAWVGRLADSGTKNPFHDPDGFDLRSAAIAFWNSPKTNETLRVVEVQLASFLQ